MTANDEVYVRMLSGSPIPETKPNGGFSGSAALQRQGVPCDLAGDSEAWGLRHHSQRGAMEVVAVDLERGVAVAASLQTGPEILWLIK
jgi:hypothetical protein